MRGIQSKFCRRLAEALTEGRPYAIHYTKVVAHRQRIVMKDGKPMTNLDGTVMTEMVPKYQTFLKEGCTRWALRRIKKAWRKGKVKRGPIPQRSAQVAKEDPTMNPAMFT